MKLADKVSKVKVYKTGKHHYQAEIWVKGTKYGTLYASGSTARADHNCASTSPSPRTAR